MSTIRGPAQHGSETFATEEFNPGGMLRVGLWSGPDEVVVVRPELRPDLPVHGDQFMTELIMRGALVPTQRKVFHYQERLPLGFADTDRGGDADERMVSIVAGTVF